MALCYMWHHAVVERTPRPNATAMFSLPAEHSPLSIPNCIHGPLPACHSFWIVPGPCVCACAAVATCRVTFRRDASGLG
mgnify:FL=1